MQRESAHTDMCIFIQEPEQGATSATFLLATLKFHYDFLLRGLGNIHVEHVEYRKSNSLWDTEHEYLVVMVKESSGAGRTGYLLVDRLDDDPTAGALASFFPAKRSRRWNPPDARERVVILFNTDEAVNVQGQCACDVLMTMDLRQASRHVTFEDFLLLAKTASRKAPSHSQCFWLAYTIWTVLELETGAHIERTRHAIRRGKHSWLWLWANLFSSERSADGVDDSRTPETIKSEWEEAKVVASQEWDASLQALRAPELAEQEALRQEQAAFQQDLAILEQERAGRLRAEAQVNELRATLSRRLELAGNVSNNA
ncbi:uncharacterized protein EV420DRAFT_1533359 [Desarmillaria tabescens]|uniref:Uncharacterized protein n=1 Tax=Armillaria tabescens TaxID=1929756 RepID=A0AA39N7W0_ARMTA|nr:uncharacterized protein EV420DRAFT_1533359 [Desarmillaria tabescens]KAK0460656.1 hypothetical protein EV420DRAFT_1533359 [Desarmillaria tabescens]